MSDHRKYVTRILWLMNHDPDGEAWLLAANRAGYKIDKADRGRFVEWRLSVDGNTCAVLHEFPDEAFAFLWVPEARAPWYSRVWWRLTHPIAVKQPLPWPRRESRAGSR